MHAILSGVSLGFISRAQAFKFEIFATTLRPRPAPRARRRFVGTGIAKKKCLKHQAPIQVKQGRDLACLSIDKHSSIHGPPAASRS